MKSLLSLMDVDEKKLDFLLNLALDVKKNPEKYSEKLKGKTLLMFFQKPSLRTRISFEVGMNQLGGRAIYVDTSTAPIGKKETYEDTAKVVSRFASCIMARLFLHDDVVKLKENASIPVINGLTNDFHPAQILADLLTITEKKGITAKNNDKKNQIEEKSNIKGLKLAYFGDAFNNVTHDLMIGCALAGIDIYVACPKGFEPKSEVFDYAIKIAKKNGSKMIVTQDVNLAAKDADIIYTDSWMSYHIAKEEEGERFKKFLPYQVNSHLAKLAKKDYIFMNCLPAARGQEQTSEIIDGKNSVVFDQAENRLHMQKAILLDLLNAV